MTTSSNSIGVIQLKGIGPVTAKKLNDEYGIFTASNLVALGDEWLEIANTLGINGAIEIGKEASNLLSQQFNGGKSEPGVVEGYDRVSRPMKRSHNGLTYRFIAINRKAGMVQANALIGNTEKLVEDKKLAAELFETFIK
jgi:TfoX/Sxy family transcriptional regulator of competence genes